jgi:hypothetical protein
MNKPWKYIKHKNQNPPPMSWAEKRLLNAIFGEMGLGEANVMSGIDDIIDNEVDYVPLHKPVDYNSWAKRGERFYSVDVTHKQLPADIYVVKKDNNGVPYFNVAPFLTDKLTPFAGTPAPYVFEQIQRFWESKETFKKLGFLHKRGILFYGSAGCGKTASIKLIVDDVIKRNGIAVYVREFAETSEGLKIFRKVEPDRPVVCIEEDIETFLCEKDETREFLAFLDGENQIDNVCHLSTTNKPEELEERIIKRPGRFDLVIGVNPPVKEARFEYLKQLLTETLAEKEIAELATQTQGLGFSHLRELVACVVCLKLDKKETLERLKKGITEKVKMKKLGNESELGFTVNFEGGK